MGSALITAFIGLSAVVSTPSPGAPGPAVDEAQLPATGLAFAVGVQRLQDDFGLVVKASSPRFASDRLALVLSAGIGWYPDLRALPAGVEDQDFGQWSAYGHSRFGLELSTSIADNAGRLYASLGPSALLLSERLSTTRLAAGGFGVVGVELFAGDELRAFLFSLFAEIGGVAHAASADVASRSGPIDETDTTVDRLIATGMFLSGGVRVYLWR